MSGFVIQGPKSDYRDSSGLKNRFFPKKNALLSDLSELGEIRLAQPHRHTDVEAHAKVAEEP